MIKNKFVLKILPLLLCLIHIPEERYLYSDCLSQNSFFSNENYSEKGWGDKKITRRESIKLAGVITPSSNSLSNSFNPQKTKATKEEVPYSVEDMFSYLTIQNPVRLTENGDSILYVSDKSGTLELWLKTEKQEKQLTFLNERVLRPKLSADKKTVIFFSDKGGNGINDLYLLNLESLEIKNITKTEMVNEYMAEFSPDGRKIAFLADLENKPLQFQIFLMDTSSQEITKLTNLDKPLCDFGEPISYPAKFKGLIWSNAGEKIACFQSETGLEGDLVLASIVDKTTKIISPPSDGKILIPYAFSQDGNYLLAGTKNKDGFMQMCLINLLTDEIRFIGPSKLNIGEVIWHHKEGIIFTQSYGGVYGLYKMSNPEAEVETILEPQGVISELDLDSSGKYLQFVKETSASPAEVFILNLRTKALKQLTNSLPKNIDRNKLSLAKPYEVNSFDGTVINGFYFEPKKQNIKKPYPAIVYVHGGPTMLIGDQFYSDIQAMCQAGFFVIAPNYRGSSGYGEYFQNLNKKDWGGGDIEDIKASAELFIKKGIIDPKHIGITGASFGGYLTLMCLVKQPNFWIAGVNFCGIPDWLSFYNRHNEIYKIWIENYFGKPSEDEKLFYERSPINFLDQLKAPLLIFHGLNDTTVPPEASEFIVSKLKHLGRDVEYITYPDEGHGFNRRPNRIDSVKRMIEFFLKHLKVNNTASQNYKLQN